MAKADLPSPELLRKLLDYNPETGALTWKARGPELFPSGKHSSERRAASWNAKHAGGAALNCVDGRGYKSGLIYRKQFLAHRVVWALVHGEWPEGQVDHINHIRTDNRLHNLRVISGAENKKNRSLDRRNKSGFNGVRRTPHHTWVAHIRHKGQTMYLGTFPACDEAVAARKAAEQRLGFHPNHGAPRQALAALEEQSDG